jgi:putative addiction module component (TIGR02574 family)
MVFKLNGMIAQSEIRQMPLAEKLAMLEALWEEISSEPDQVEIPQWHKDILDERFEAVDRGEVEVIDWEVAKNQIRQMLR